MNSIMIKTGPQTQFDFDWSRKIVPTSNNTNNNVKTIIT